MATPCSLVTIQFADGEGYGEDLAANEGAFFAVSHTALLVGILKLKENSGGSRRI